MVSEHSIIREQLLEKELGENRRENADLSNEIIVEAIRLVQGF